MGLHDSEDYPLFVGSFKIQIKDIDGGGKMTFCVARRHGEPKVGWSVARESRSVGLGGAGAKKRSEV
jgi:hypothetical protein